MLAQWIALALASHSLAADGTVTPFADREAHRTSDASLRDMAGHWIDLGSAKDLRSLRLDFIRANVVVRRSASARIRLLLDMSDAAHDLDGVTIHVEHSAAAVELTDVYPAQTAYARMIECLPQIDGRGDFWIASSHLRVTVLAPVSFPVEGLVRDGTFHDERKSLIALSPR
jgi:hypothetical protein